MFDGLAEAAAALGKAFDPPRLEQVVEALVPAIVFKPAGPEGPVAEGSQIGGTPDVPAGFVWPRPTPLADARELTGRANAEMGQEMLAHIEMGLPYAFVAQVDLGEAAKLGDVAANLPSDGRLLFFYDFPTGPWNTGTRSARVIWDTSPTGNLSQATVPDDLAAAARSELDELGDLRPDGKGGTNYGAPRRPMTLAATWRLPHPAALESEELLSSGTADKDGEAETFREDYEEALEAHHDGYTRELWRRQQLLGSPQPEQDDPRLEAVVVSKFGVQHLSREVWKERYPAIKAEAAEWTLLLQLDVGDWMQAEFVEGTVYFVIRKDDLQERHFERVVAVYQQT
ncbi:DUF1963 domain-containing protein [Aurantimonas endophytica]|uniref:DUF1963 domain-containing protein n=1 Tax=Aurantimonas endophytica TaxID=1522175 RepID=A0A7W6HDM5_9HYPH|nr:DUF1963 domain-containing protein [Aurantimonas endophytica]MBB4003218.1 hypothetical protein [Aurantimonas endophytica]MCO6404082.1 DUF1963 domain-containing protein [Aurantimonas endophytica]